MTEFFFRFSGRIGCNVRTSLPRQLCIADSFEDMIDARDCICTHNQVNAAFRVFFVSQGCIEQAKGSRFRAKGCILLGTQAKDMQFLPRTQKAGEICLPRGRAGAFLARRGSAGPSIEKGGEVLSSVADNAHRPFRAVEQYVHHLLCGVATIDAHVGHSSFIR